MRDGQRLLGTVLGSPLQLRAQRETAKRARPYGLTGSVGNDIAVGVVVLALFFERFERIRVDGTYPFLPVPDFIFLSAIAVLASKAAFELAQGRLALRPLGIKDLGLSAFVGLLAVVSVAAAATQPGSVASDAQLVKTLSHLVVLLGATLLLGRVLSNQLVEHALWTFFGGAVFAAGLGVLQALDQNLLMLGVADALKLTSRQGTEFVIPCSIFSEPAYLGYSSIGGILIGGTLVARRHPVVGLGGCAICAAGLLIGAAMGPIAVAAPLGLYVLIKSRPLRLGGAPVAVVVTVVALVWFLTPVRETVGHRAKGISVTVLDKSDVRPSAPADVADPSAELRAKLNQNSIDVWRQAPLTGVGLGNTRNNVSGVVFGSSQSFNSANAYVNLLGEAGPLGVAGLLASFFILWRRNPSAPAQLEELTRAFIVLLALSFLIINPLVMPPLWFWAGQRLALQET